MIAKQLRVLADGGGVITLTQPAFTESSTLAVAVTYDDGGELVTEIHEFGLAAKGESMTGKEQQELIDEVTKLRQQHMLQREALAWIGGMASSLEDIHTGFATIRRVAEAGLARADIIQGESE